MVVLLDVKQVRRQTNIFACLYTAFPCFFYLKGVQCLYSVSYSIFETLLTLFSSNFWKSPVCCHTDG